ncbi:glycosyl hydrolase family 18 protein [Ammoniphilus sp. YIM 78166]|uniref:glycosyl hydrolase family 18 protein n=1 Tax=Ammoniphilus sp. YIM 78166 TaxID=1644106 RepID=UPI00106FB561|nr:glycosyl hydrolase family 18 protein [Ammoniphilus sp. YIM 78166]
MLRKSFLLLLIMMFAVLPFWQSTSANEPKKILGFYTVYYQGDKSSYQSIASFGSYINQVSTVTYRMDTAGKVIGTAPTDAIALAHAGGIQPYAAVTNEANGQFDSQLANAILSNASVRQSAVQNLLALVRENGYKGVNIDFENMLPSDRAHFTLFITELSQVLRAHGFETIVSVSAKTSDSPNVAWVGAFDYQALGQAADFIQVMTYDQHGPWGSPGPVAGLNWVENVVKYAVSQIPSSKVMIGLPAYGYEWNTTTNTGNRAVAWKNIPALLSSTGAVSQWDATAQSPYFRYTATDGTSRTVWYENELSIELKTKLVNTYNLAGVSMWCMRLEDEAFWKAVHKGLGTTVPAEPTEPALPAESFTTLAANKAEYLAGEQVTIQTTIKDKNNQPLAGAQVKVTVTSPSGSVTHYSGTTNSQGSYMIYIKTNKQKAEKGLYVAHAQSSLPNYQVSTGETSYRIK